jgi:hypothetical protein
MNVFLVTEAKASILNVVNQLPYFEGLHRRR